MTDLSYKTFILCDHHITILWKQWTYPKYNSSFFILHSILKSLYCIFEGIRKHEIVFSNNLIFKLTLHTFIKHKPQNVKQFLFHQNNTMKNIYYVQCSRRNVKMLYAEFISTKCWHVKRHPDVQEVVISFVWILTHTSLNRKNRKKFFQQYFGVSVCLSCGIYFTFDKVTSKVKNKVKGKEFSKGKDFFYRYFRQCLFLVFCITEWFHRFWFKSNKWN